MSRDLCRGCGQPLPALERGGVYLPARKAVIFDCVQRHPTITAEGIQAHCYRFPMSIQGIRVHISQINEKLAGTSVRIRAQRGCFTVTGLPARGTPASKPRTPPAPTSYDARDSVLKRLPSDWLRKHGP
jgi:hypothetical protein